MMDFVQWYCIIFMIFGCLGSISIYTKSHKEKDLLNALIGFLLWLPLFFRIFGWW